MDNNQVKVEVTATSDKLEAGMKNSVNAVKSSVDEIKSTLEGMNSGFSKVTAGFAAFTAVLAGGSALKSFVSGALESTKEALTLGKALGITATEASYFKSALAQAGVSQDAVLTAGKRMTMQLLQNEDAFKKLGVATRDNEGHLRNTKDVMLDTNAAIREFREGTDRNVEGMKIYGRQWAEIAPFVNKFKGETEESRKEAESLNLVVGQEAVSALADYKSSQIGVKEVMEGVTNTIGNAIIPRLTELGKWFKEIGPDAVTATHVAMQAYLTVQDAVKDSIKALWNVISTAFSAITNIVTKSFGGGGQAFTAMEMFENVVKVVQIAFIGFRIGIETGCAIIEGAINNIVIVFKGLAAVAYAALVERSWDATVKAAKKAGDEIVDNFDKTIDKMTDIAVKGREDIDKVVSVDMKVRAPVTAIKEKTGGERSQGADTPVDKTKDRMKSWEADLLALKTKYMEENDMREMSLQDEKAYWQKVLTIRDISEKEKGGVRKKAAEAELADMKRMAGQRLEIQKEVIAFEQKLGLESIEQDKAEADEKLALGLMTNLQRLKMEEDFENQKYVINKKALIEQLKLADKDPTKNLVERQKIMDQILLMEQKHQGEITKIRSKQTLETNKDWISIANTAKSSMASAITGVLTGAQSLRSALTGLFKSIGTMMIEELIAKPLAERAIAAITGKALNVADAASYAGVAGAAGVASAAAIPLIGWEIAPEAGAMDYAAAMSFAATASARNGFDIPAGVNPVTQLHEREMVLPAQQADVIRDMADSGSTGANGAFHVTINAVDASSVKKLFMQHGSALVASLKAQNRNFAG